MDKLKNVLKKVITSKITATLVVFIISGFFLDIIYPIYVYISEWIIRFGFVGICLELIYVIFGEFANRNFTRDSLNSYCWLF